jgi:hypothetical protein
MANTDVQFRIQFDGTESINSLNKGIKETKDSMKDLATTTAEYNEKAEILGELEGKLKLVKKQQDDVNKSFLKSQSALRPYDQLSAKLNKLRKDYKDLAVTGQGSTNATKELLKEIQALDNQLKQTDANVGQYQRNVGNYGDAVKGIAENLGGVGTFASQAVGGVQAFGAAWKAALGPIGLIIAAIGILIGSVRAFFNSSEEGQNKFRRLQAVLTVVFNNLRDIFAELGGLIVSVFENPIESIKAFGQAIKTYFINTIVGSLELIPKLAKSIGLLFTGDFKKAGQVAADAFAKASLGVEDFTNKAVNGFNTVNKAMSDFAKNTEMEIARQNKLSTLQENLSKQSRAILVQNAQLEQQIAENRNKFAQKDKFNNEERLKFLDEAIKQENLILKNNEFIAATRLRIAREQNNLNSQNGKKTGDMLEEEAQLEADLIRLKTENLNKTKELAAQRVEALNAIKAESDKLISEEKKRQEELEKTRKKFLEDDLKFTEAAAKLNADIISKTNKLVTGFIQDEFMKRRKIANENFANDVRLTEEQIALRKKENEKRLADAEEALGKESEAFLKIREEITNEEKQIIDSFDKFRIEREKQLVNELAVIKGDEVKATIAAEEAKRDEIKKTNDIQQKITNDYYSELNKKIQQAGEFAKIAIDTITGFAEAAEQKRLDRIEKDEEANSRALENLNERLQRATGLERRFLEERIASEEETTKKLAKEKEKIEKESAKRRKATAIIESVINTALAVSSALATPPAPNVVAALIAGIAGAAQTAVIAAQPLAKGGVVGKGDEIVQFASGGRVTSKGNIKPLSNGDNVLATLKTGEIVLNESQQRRIGYASLKKAQIPNFANGGLVGAPSTLITNANNSIANEQMRVNLMDEMISATNNRIDRLSVVYTATTDYEVEKGRNDKKTIKANSTF